MYAGSVLLLEEGKVTKQIEQQGKDYEKTFYLSHGMSGIVAGLFRGLCRFRSVARIFALYTGGADKSPGVIVGTKRVYFHAQTAFTG